MELFLGEGLVTFDGKVIEGFGVRAEACGRAHLASLAYVELGEAGGQLYIRPLTVWGSSPFLLPFPEDQRAVAEWFISEIERARAALRPTGR